MTPSGTTWAGQTTSSCGKQRLISETISVIRSLGPFWDAKGGADHIFLVSEEYGKCALQLYGLEDPRLASAITLTPWGYTRNMLGTAEGGPCFRPGQDIVIPPSAHLRFLQNASMVREAGGLPGLRVFELYAGRDSETGFKVEVVPEGGEELAYGGMEHSVFCLATAGHGWHASLAMAVIAGCVPVVIQPDVLLPFEGDGVDWSLVSYRLNIRDIPQLHERLQAIPPEDIELKQKHLRQLWPLFIWSAPQFNPVDFLPEGAQMQLTAIDTFTSELDELEGMIDGEYEEVPVHTVTVHDRERGVTYTVDVPQDQYILQTAEEEGIKLPFACRHGCCTACAVRVISGELVQPRALGISQELKEKGYALLCVGSPFLTLRRSCCFCAAAIPTAAASFAGKTNADSKEGSSQEKFAERPLLRNAIIVGGGIAGLTAAIALRRQGVDVQVYEKAEGRDPERVGRIVGIQPNGLAALRCIDPAIADALSSQGAHGSSLCQLAPSGEVLLEATAPADGRFSLRWGFALEVLQSFLPHSRVHQGCEFTGHVQHSGHRSCAGDRKTGGLRLSLTRSLAPSHLIGRHWMHLRQRGHRGWRG
ncbi:unnamed protein product [Closterium sp. Yama58-4]|nr:unnamed protein product [Closterium sp. Yama58-4]